MKEQNFYDFINQVKESNDIVQVISSFTSLNSHYMAICPIHQDKKPSLRVYPDTQSFYCFGCHAGGDVISFISLYKNISFMDALSFLADNAGLRMPVFNNNYSPEIQHNRSIEDILSSTAQYYHSSLTQEVKEYLIKERMISEDTIERFLIGYARGGLKNHLTKTCNYSIEDCLEAGVLINNQDSGIRDFFYNRITLPNFKYGRVINIAARSFPEGEPKYINLRGRPIEFYNQDALRSKEIIITEGVFDCLQAVQHGYKAVSLQGAGIFKEEYIRLFQNVEKVYVCLDGDQAGRDGMKRIGSLLQDKARLVSLPEGKDLDECLKENSIDEFQKLLSESRDPIVYEIELIPEDTEPIELSNKLTPVLKRISMRKGSQQEIFLTNYIQKRFNFTAKQIDAFRKEMKAQPEKDKDEEKEYSIEEGYKAVFPDLVDLVNYKGDVAYLIKEGDTFSIEKSITIDGGVFIPPQKEQLLFSLPDGERVLSLIKDKNESDRNLYEDTIELFAANFDLPSDDYYHLLCLWVLHTYLLENFHYSPQICLLSLESRGKTRTGTTLIYTAYRGIFTQEIREPVIIRMSELFNASFFFDVWQIWETAKKTQSVDLLLQRFQHGSQVARVIAPERASFEDYRIFSSFGPTIYATNEPSHRLLESRGIEISMIKSKRSFEKDITRERLIPYKERMVAFRARHLGEVLPECDKPSAERLGDIMKPLYQVLKLVCPDREQKFLSFVAELEEERKSIKSESGEAEIIEALISLESKVDGGRLYIKDIVEKVNEGTHERNQKSPKSIGRLLRTMGFKGKRLHGGARGIEYDKDKIYELAIEHGLDISEPPSIP